MANPFRTLAWRWGRSFTVRSKDEINSVIRDRKKEDPKAMCTELDLWREESGPHVRPEAGLQRGAGSWDFTGEFTGVQRPALLPQCHVIGHRETWNL